MTNKKLVASMRSRFHVFVYYSGGASEQVRTSVPVAEAFDAFWHHTRSIGARLGALVHVVICDMRDNINAEWTFKDGIVFPTPTDVEELHITLAEKARLKQTH